MVSEECVIAMILMGVCIETRVANDASRLAVPPPGRRYWASKVQYLHNGFQNEFGVTVTRRLHEGRVLSTRGESGWRAPSIVLIPT